ncbi:ABC transporter protein [Halomicronema hongdechloris C2206]|uniref:ABC transporter protein n=1 Tax=Halomicronema hongdechloris C2206 TaxID=1641165 RepID=A0A1Z3HUX9_9CYAN|nr:phosphonate ABC transporter ATP-binding protein [Halomicronema hongdechloris]ASC74093.1 ABC transporter protein [Halomicronema hongdechloris C2206]
MAMATPMIQLTRVSRRFAAEMAVSQVSTTIAAGERVALLGPSGAGKSTLLALLNGSLPISSGRLRVLGQDLSRLRPSQLRRVQRRIGTIYQQHHLVLNLPVIHNVNAGHLGRWSLLQAAWSLVWPLEVAKAAQALEQVGIAEKLYARTDQLSGGQQQRVALARVLVQDPSVILADEPTASVDPQRAQELMSLLCQLADTGDKTLVVSLHDVELAYRHCDRILGLRQGRLLFDAPAAQVSPAMIAELYQL